ncbi:PfaD family polyunsaturated fatty acid/polyketide biosynthesis protein [Streptomyces longwoodensis]|uniref:PfaD family polyunsaturated fatty acid/polyketide biosynthesis protein n=1 Tax=Streptomyces longwoodensis TaxID=68231 RepID=UPI0033BFD6A7
MTTLPTAPAEARPGTGPGAPDFTPTGALLAAQAPRSPVHVLHRHRDGARGVLLATGPEARPPEDSSWQVMGSLPPLLPEWLGDAAFLAAHRVQLPYVVGEMANGIASGAMVVAAARAGMLGVFGAAGLAPGKVEKEVAGIRQELGNGPGWAVNLIHSPSERGMEDVVADLLLTHRVPTVSVSAFMELTPAVGRLALSGIRRLPDGSVHRPVRIMAKVSRPETARAFMSPAPPDLVATLVAAGHIDADEAHVAARVPIAEDITAEADSGGHTDNRPLSALLPRLIALREELAANGLPVARIGAAGGLGTPHAVAAAFAAGAAYVVTGSVNQTAVEAGVSEEARALLAGADLTDTVMAPAADMFELGVQVQVLARGTMFARRARLLYHLYQQYGSLDDLPGAVRTRLERELLRATVEEVWTETEGFWQRRDPRELERAAGDPRHRMALLFRWYLGQSSRWAITGTADRRLDYQLWCGPAIGAFNHWVAGSFLAAPEARTVSAIGWNLLEGATAITRAQQLRAAGVPVPSSAFAFVPRRPARPVAPAPAL